MSAKTIRVAKKITENNKGDMFTKTMKSVTRRFLLEKFTYEY